MGAIPPVKVTQGELCETLLQEMYKSTYDHLKYVQHTAAHTRK